MQFLHPHSAPPTPTPFTLLSKICMHLLQRRTISTQNVENYLFILFIYSFIIIFVVVVVYILLTQHVVVVFFLQFYILRCNIPYSFTSCVVTYPTVRKHHFRQPLFEIFMKVIYPFSHFLPIQIPEWVYLGDTENHYETCL